jgi:plastocyanin
MKKIMSLGLAVVAVVVLTAAGCQSGSRPDIAKEGGLAPVASVANNIPEAVAPAPEIPASVPAKVKTEAPAAPSQTVAAPRTVDIKNFAFAPSALTVPKGTKITWTNNDSAPHKIDSDSFNSATLSQGQSFSYTFNQAGTFSYFCSLHPSMKGSITVQ